MRWMSPELIDTASVRTSTSPGPGAGVGTRREVTVAAVPYRSCRQTVIVAGRVGAVMRQSSG